MLTAYDMYTAQIFDEAGIEVLLVGDSASNNVYGNETSLPVTVDELIPLTRAVSRSVKRSLVVGDLPFGSYQRSPEQAYDTAVRFMKEGGAHAVKLEGGREMAPQIELLSRGGVPVMAHIGFTPQSEHALGGYRVQGRGDTGERILDDARAVEAAGAFAVVMEMVPGDVAGQVTKELTIPTIGIGAGVDCDAQVLVWQDAFGHADRQDGPLRQAVRRRARRTPRRGAGLRRRGPVRRPSPDPSTPSDVIILSVLCRFSRFANISDVSPVTIDPLTAPRLGRDPMAIFSLEEAASERKKRRHPVQHKKRPSQPKPKPKPKPKPASPTPQPAPQPPAPAPHPADARPRDPSTPAPPSPADRRSPPPSRERLYLNRFGTGFTQSALAQLRAAGTPEAWLEQPAAPVVGPRVGQGRRRRLAGSPPVAHAGREVRDRPGQDQGRLGVRPRPRQLDDPAPDLLRAHRARDDDRLLVHRPAHPGRPRPRLGLPLRLRRHHPRERARHASRTCWSPARCTRRCASTSTTGSR